MRQLSANAITEAVARLCITANTRLPQDVKDTISAARQAEPWPVAQDILDKLMENYSIGGDVPICQDTGMACVFLEVGQQVYIDGDLTQAVDEGVRRGYADGYLRKSVVADPLDRVNTGDNTPAMLHVELVPGDRIKITVAPKGFGSENMSRIAMLRPSDGVEGVKPSSWTRWSRPAPTPAPPSWWGWASAAPLTSAPCWPRRPCCGTWAAATKSPSTRSWRTSCWRRSTLLGIGPQGFGGRTTALAVHIETLPTHIAGLPCAVNINCHVARHQTEVL